MFALRLGKQHAAMFVSALAFAMLSTVSSHSQEREIIRKPCSTLSKPGTYQDYARLPSYSILRRERVGAPPGIMALRISMGIDDFNGGAILRLGCKLLSDFRRENAVEALLFDDADAAKKLALGFTDQPHFGTYLWHLRGRFEWNTTDTGSAFVEFLIPEATVGLPKFRRITYRLSDQEAP